MPKKVIKKKNNLTVVGAIVILSLASVGAVFTDKLSARNPINGGAVLSAKDTRTEAQIVKEARTTNQDLLHKVLNFISIK